MILKKSEIRESSQKKSDDKAEFKAVPEASGKIKFGLMATPEVMDIINESFQKDGSACRSMLQTTTEIYGLMWYHLSARTRKGVDILLRRCGRSL